MSKYYEDRIKKGIYKTYNSLEERNIELLKFYKQASEDIRTELYKIAEKVQKATNKDEISLTDMHRFKRLKALNEKNYQIVEELTSKTEAFGKEGMIEGFEKVYSEASVAVGNIDFALPNGQLMEELLKRPWRGSYFSERLWKNSEKLGKVLNDTLRVGLQQGRTVAQIAIELDNVMQKGFNAAHRLVRTETMHFLNQSSMRAYRDAGITHVMDVVTMDERTSEECAEHNGEIYPIDKAPILPRHPNCRCTLIAVVDVDAEAEETENPTDETPDFKAYGKNKVYHKSQVERMAKDANRVLDKHISIPSKWSGNIVFVQRNSHTPAGKMWNCDIAVAEEMGGARTSMHVLMHELLHARSVSYYSSKVYRSNQVMEEAVVQLMNTEISKREKIKVIKSGYNRRVKQLRAINKKIDYGSDYEFSKAIFEIPLPDRCSWLESQIFDYCFKNGYDVVGTTELQRELLEGLK